MELEHHFTVEAPVDQAWDVLLDLERIAPCMPGATLTSYAGDEFTGTVRVRLGPVTMTFAGQGRFVARDAGARTMVIEASGKDRRGGGTARATIRAALRSEGDSTTAVAVRTDLVVTGRVAQFGRGMIADLSTRLLGQFTECLAGTLAEPATPAAPGAAPPSTPSMTATPSTPMTATASAPAPPPARAGPGWQAPVGSPPGGAAGPTPEAEPIDLLGVTGVRATAGRVLPYLVTFLVGALVGAGIAALLLR